MSAPVIDVDEVDFEEKVLRASQEVPVVVDFWAGWCQPCLILSPMLERLAEEHDGAFVLAKVDVDANPNLSTLFGIQSIPAVKAFREGQVVAEFVGVQPEDVLRRFVEEILPSPADELASQAEAARESGDLVEAEALFREALSKEPSHQAAKLGLAALLAMRGEDEEARGLLAQLPATEGVRQLDAALELRSAAGGEEDREALRIRAEAGDREADLTLAMADAAAGEHRAALERSLRLVESGGDQRDRARDLMVRIFEALGEEHPLTREFRPRLASALF
ncbi:MAG TPA: tetratricopeptide repeat protein [Actinomycetota bacterium]|jgi:putative thioredoxin|nr:tetratricopeptide repeat protein [Actinomycetota bacterium]